ARPATAPPVPRRGGPRPGGYPPASPRTARSVPGQRTAPESRTRFVFLIVGLLGGGLLCLLMINTVLAAGAFQITALQQGNVPRAQQVQALQAEVAAEQSPNSLAQRAAALGMVVQARLHFLNLSTGRLQSQPSYLPGIPTVPGYTPGPPPAVAGTAGTGRAAGDGRRWHPARAARAPGVPTMPGGGPSGSPAGAARAAIPGPAPPAPTGRHRGGVRP